MLLRLLLISCSFSIVIVGCPASYAAQPVTMSKADRNLLKQPIGYDVEFPENSGSFQRDQAAKFLNQALKSNPNNYQTLLRDLTQQDKILSNDPAISTPPGSFLNDVANLYATIQIDPAPPTSTLSNSDQTAAIIAEEQQLLEFATILQKEAKILNRAPTSAQDRISALETALAAAKANGTLPPKVYVYSDSPAEKVQYEEVVERYYPGHENLVYNVVPSRYDPLYINRLAEEAAEIGEGLVFFDRLPESYPPFWAPEWKPYFSAYPEGRFYEGWGGRPHDIRNFFDNNHRFNNPNPINPAVIGNRAAAANQSVVANRAVAPTNRAVVANRAVAPTNRAVVANRAVAPTNRAAAANRAVAPTNRAAVANRAVAPTNRAAVANRSIAPITVQPHPSPTATHPSLVREPARPQVHAQHHPAPHSAQQVEEEHRHK